MKKICDVSIVCANYNNENFLEDFFNSIIDSTYLPKDIIVVDDCSTDKSVVVINTYVNKFDNFKLIKLTKNVGFANALNEGIKHVTTQYILRVDPDDILASDRIEKQYNFLLNNKDIDIVGSNICYFYNNFRDCKSKSNFPQKHNEIMQRYLDGLHGLVHGGVMIKSHLLKENLYRQEYVPAEEYDIFSRLLSKGFISYNLDDILTFVRIHEKSVSNNMPFSTVKKTFILRKEIWRIDTSSIYIYKEFIARNLYRNSLNKKGFIKFVILILVGILKPTSLLKRIIKYVK
jgi:glycosyltransferase involved in cell wall biosynthesis